MDKAMLAQMKGWVLTYIRPTMHYFILRLHIHYTVTYLAQRFLSSYCKDLKPRDMGLEFALSLCCWGSHQGPLLLTIAVHIEKLNKRKHEVIIT